jgi:hypothetical protein
MNTPAKSHNVSVQLMKLKPFSYSEDLSYSILQRRLVELSAGRVSMSSNETAAGLLRPAAMSSFILNQFFYIRLDRSR